jgi:anti-sigma28 factor (negative regulator of flagellin synthesis)
MRLRLKVRDVINILIMKDYKKFSKEYGVNRKKINSIQKALREGNWKVEGRVTK